MHFIEITFLLKKQISQTVLVDLFFATWSSLSGNLLLSFCQYVSSINKSWVLTIPEY